MTRQHNEGSERAVSPVIGVILMVATTVIVSAIIGSFTLGATEIGGAAQAGVTVDEVEDESLSFSVVTPGNVDRLEILAPVGQEFKEMEGSCSSYFGNTYWSGFPEDGYAGDWETSDDDEALVNDDPTAGDRIRMDGRADMYLSSSDTDNIEEGDVFTVVAFTDGKRNVLLEHEVSSEEIPVNSDDCQ